LAWAATLFVVIVASTFVHEIGHGIGAMVDGVHVSTGFNKIGMPGKTPADPDFRTGMPDGIWLGLLGPLMTWALALGFTLALYSLKRPTKVSFVIGALAVANGLVRAVPMTSFLLCALGGVLHIEDEVAWGIWIVTNILSTSFKGVARSEIPAGLLLSYPAVWIPPLLSLAISLCCFVFAFRRIFRLEAGRLAHWGSRALVIVLALIAEFAKLPVINALDRVIRINW
jgi:hypothetical protein